MAFELFDEVDEATARDDAASARASARCRLKGPYACGDGPFAKNVRRPRRKHYLNSAHRWRGEYVLCRSVAGLRSMERAAHPTRSSDVFGIS